MGRFRGFREHTFRAGLWISFTETYYTAAQNISNDGIDLPVDDQSLKVSFQIYDWPFEGNTSYIFALPIILFLSTNALLFYYRKFIRCSIS